jgi:hypothetical protein
MHHKNWSTFFLAVPMLLASVLPGCISSPAARTQKFYDQGLRDFSRQKYPEAIISFTRALQIDPRFADAHYQMSLLKNQVVENG